MRSYRLLMVATVILFIGPAGCVLARGEVMQPTKATGVSAALFAEVDRLLGLVPLTPAGVAEA
jgi:hypothetical protein